MSRQRLSQTAVMIADSVDRLLTGAEGATGSNPVWDAALWEALVESGAPEALAATLHEQDDDDEALGIGGALNLLFVAGQHAAPVPLAEHMLAAWIAGSAGIDLPAGLVVAAGLEPGDSVAVRSGRLSGVAHHVPFARHAQAVLVVLPGEVALVPLAAAGIVERDNLAGEPRDTLRFDDIAVTCAPSAFDREMLRAAFAGARAVQMAGALDSVLRLTAGYVQERSQFGRPISKFQAVQQAIAELGGQVATTRAAAELASDAFGRPDGIAVLAAAKIRAGEAVGIASRIAHQAHGAIGFTQEYALQRFTRRLWSWRDEYGSESHWARWLGLALTDRAAGRGAETLWPLLTEGLRFAVPVGED